MGFLSSLAKGALGVFTGNPGAVISAGASLAGGLAQNAANKKVSDNQMAFQERMSSTAHQREVADLKAAGLNPILSARFGGSSTPSGSGVPMQNAAAGIPGAVSSAIQLKRVQSEIDSLESTAALNAEKINTERTSQELAKANAGLSTANTSLSGANTALSLERVNTQKELTNQERIRVSTAMATLGKTRMESIQAEAAADRAIQQGNIDRSEVGQFIGWLARAKELGIGLDTVLGLLSRRKKGGAFPRLPSPSNNFLRKSTVIE